MNATTQPHPDQLLFAPWVLPMTGEHRVMEGACVAIAEGRIIDILDAATARSRWPDAPALELDDQVLLPGFVNCHGHAAMCLMRGFADDLPLEPWLNDRIWPLEGRWVGAEYVADGTRLAITEMLRSGTTTFSDMYFFPEAAAAAAHRAGIRAQICMPLIQFPTGWASGTDEGITKGIELAREFRDHERVSIAFGPHSVYTMEEHALARVATLAETMELPVQIHAHETAAEVAQAHANSGRRPIEILIETGLFGPRLQTVHMTQLEPGDAELLATHDVSVVHCVQSNLKIASGMCPIAELRAAGVRVGLGTDGAASNNSLSMLREMHIAALVAKVRADDAGAIPAYEALRMATLGGAEVLGIDHITGSLTAGKAADIIAIDLSGPATTPVFDPVSQVVYTGTEARVSHVWVDGQMLLADGTLTRIDEEDVIARANLWRDRMVAEEGAVPASA